MPVTDAVTDADPFQSIADLAARIRTRDLSPVALTERVIARIRQLDPKLHSHIAITEEAALRQAHKAEAEIARGQYRGPLHGMPLGFKDLLHVKGTPTTFASPAYRTFLPEDSATIIENLEAAGAVLVGRHHHNEGAMAEHNPDFGPVPVNPFNAAISPGGSSSGTGVAVASALCAGGLGSDTGGSIRFPSSANGLTGLKPTWGRVSRRGVMTFANSLDVIGPMCRSAEDAAILLNAIAGADDRDPTSLPAPVPDYRAELEGVNGARDLRIGVDWRYVSDGVAPFIVEAIREALSVFTDIGARVVEFDMPDAALAARAMCYFQFTELANYHAERFAEAPELFGEKLTFGVETGRSLKAVDVARGYIDRDIFRGQVARKWQEVDVFVTPVMQGGELRFDPDTDFFGNLARLHYFTGPYSASGNPALVFPIGMADTGVPFGIQMVAPHLGESRLFRAAHAFQQATDWHLRRPQL